jgi:hypothetical protein
MDELEISGKRYISTRRAAKEYKYHSDYIGQLIRGKKLLGRKVGRSWYVELESLTQHFGKEGASIAPAPVVAKAVAQKPAQVAPVEVITAPEEVVVSESEVVVEKEPELVVVEEIKIQQPKIISQPVARVEQKMPEIKTEPKEASRDAIHIPIRVRRPSFEAPAKKAPTLTYVSDDEPYVPLTRVEENMSPVTTVMPRTEEEAEEIFEEEYAPTNNSTPLKSIFGVMALGVIVFVVAMGGSILVSSQTVIEAGKTASVGYTLQ